MSDLAEIRRSNLRALIKKEGGPSSLGRRLGHSGPSYLSQLASGKAPITEKVVRKIEHELGLDPRALDADGSGVPFAGTDHATLAAAVRAIGEELERAKAQPAPKKFAELVALVYEHAIQAGAVDPGYVRKLIRLL